MRYNLANTAEAAAALNALEEFRRKGVMIELKEKRPVRQLRANRYFHSILSLVAVEIGLSLEEAKQEIKRACPFMHYEKDGKTYLRSTSALDSKEFTDLINWLRNYAAPVVYLPNADEYGRKEDYYNDIIRSHREWL